MKNKFILVVVFTLFVLISGVVYMTSSGGDNVYYELEKLEDVQETSFFDRFTGEKKDSVNNAPENADNVFDSSNNGIQSATYNKSNTVSESYNETDGSMNQNLAAVDNSEDYDIIVYLYGAVKDEGVYQLNQGARVYEALEMAGGMTKEAASGYVNLARVLVDGESVYFPTVDEELELKEEETSVAVNDPRVNINSASADELTVLPGIGDTKANSIVAYRTLNGTFKSKEEIMNVSGIKESLYESISGLIRVD